MKIKQIFSSLLAAGILFTTVPMVMTTRADAATEETDVSSVTITADTSWYAADKTSFSISSASQLLGFAKLLQTGTTFEGKTINLTADIDLNPGWVASATAAAATNNWNSAVGTNHSGKLFQGSFDGQNHTISGVYYSGYETCMGLFLKGKGASVKNLTVSNTLFVATGWRTGLIFGMVDSGESTVENVTATDTVYIVHQNSDLSSAPSLGGLVGRLDADTASVTVEKCVCNAYIADTCSSRSVSTLAGGLVAEAASRTVTVSGSTFGGDIVLANGNYYNTGLFVGGSFSLNSGAAAGTLLKVTISNCKGLIGTAGAFRAFLASIRHAAFTGSSNSGNAFELTADIDLKDLSLIAGVTGNYPAASAWSGTLDGKGHTVSNMTLNANSNYDGLLGNAMDASVKNINFADCAISGVGRYGVGGLFGVVAGTAKLENVVADIAVLRSRDETKDTINPVAGLVASVGYGSTLTGALTLEGCIFTGSVTSKGITEGTTVPRVAGGLVGLVTNKSTCQLDRCAFLGTLTAENVINGGLVARADANTTLTIENSYSNGSYVLTIEKKYCGEIVGQNESKTAVTLNNCVYVASGKTSWVAHNVTTGYQKMEAAAAVTLNGKKLSGTTAVVGLSGYQYGASGVRLVGYVDKLDYSSLTLELEITAGGVTKTKTVTIDTVYSSVLADGVAVTAEELGGKYVFAVVVTGIPAGDAMLRVATAANGAVTDYVTCQVNIPAQQ